MIATGESKSEYAREVEKWDLPKSRGGYRPDGYEPFPKMIYRAVRVDGRVTLEDRTVLNSEDLERVAREGFVVGPDAAKAALYAQEQAVAVAAAEAAHAAQRMSPKARAEYAKTEDEQDTHVTDVTPARGRRS